MRQLLFLAIFSVFVFNEVYCTTSYATVVKTFAKKAKNADPALKKDWNKNLGILFNLSKNIPKHVLTHTLVAYQIPANVKSHTLALFAGMKQTAIVQNLIADYRIVLGNEPTLNKLCDDLIKRIKNDLKGENFILHANKFNEWEKKNMEKSHVEKIALQLGDMKFDFLRFHTKFTSQLNAAYEAKEAFIRASSLIPNAIINERDKMNELSISMASYKKAQVQIYHHLNTAWNVSCEYIKKRDEWVDFIIGE
ncbi:uncharacterized protein LOC116349705 [Contarinia nasturtii]|uniref:uncharacterized protein LOC116349705 n=1 Tax=Contarinia nasturtii TaxID=265458 RepID=UPI0012D4B5E5|nr:uncharacterized protein LOC116349705 [Contarinia nasturtii]XP_031637113.1 uncharacterized protein LOC116349705 [Contarinia nasturtii]